MENIQLFLEQNIYWIKLFSIPFISGFIGWFTNWQAIKMTFSPLDFWGLKIGRLKIGWQGIIPANGAKMARIGVEMTTQKLFKIEELFDRLDSDKIARQLQPEMLKLLEKTVERVMHEKANAIWTRVPINVKKILYSRIASDIPSTVVQMLEDIKLNHEQLLDFKKMYVTSILKDKSLLNELFLRCGKAEFKFIERSGWWFGFLFGIFQMLAWHYYPASWTLPVAGVIVGYATNWLALKLIFKPEEKRKFLFWEFQGLFIKRQMEVSEEYAKVVAEKVLTGKNIWNYMLSHNNGDAVYAMMEKHVSIAMDNLTSGNVNIIATALAPKKYQSIRNSIIKHYAFVLPANLNGLHPIIDSSFDLKNLLKERMQVMSPKDFVGVLRPAFEEEEWILILVGALLGGIAGFAQWALVFGGLM